MTLFRNSIFLLLCLWVQASFATELGGRLSTLVDSSNSLRLEEIRTSKRFVETKERSINIGYTDATLWTKIELANHASPVVITIENAHIDYLNCYIFDQKNTLRKIGTGDLVEFSKRDIQNNLFSFLCKPDENVVYLEAKSSGSVALPIRIHTLEEFFVYDRNNQIVFWLFMGISLIALFANLLFYFSLKEKSYLYYAVYVLSNVIFGLVDNETSFQYLWPNLPELNKLNILFYGAPALSLVFCNHLLELKKNIPILYKTNIAVIWLRLLCGLYSLIDYQTGAIISIFFILVPVFIFISAILVYIKTKSLVALLFLISWFCYLAGIVVYMGATVGMFTYYASISNIVLMTLSLEMVLIFVIVVFKINAIKEQNILLLTKKEQSLLQEAIRLEQMVNERTWELQLKNEEVTSQNEEIKSQNEELFSQQTLLESQYDLIAKANEELTEYKEHLEEIVEKRTAELKLANSDLENKNKQLEQFAFMAAHNLRSPVATIMGLTLLMEDDDTADTQREVVKRISMSVRKLDVIVKSLSSILSDPKVALKLFEECHLDLLAKESKDILFAEIAESNAHIATNFTSCKVVSSVKAYMHNLFYNMLSNAMKYRKPDKDAQIEITSQRFGTDVQIIFKDYGMGLDLAQHGHELFVPFKRFSNKIEGAGIGLYLIKTQMEALGGSIKVESTFGESTTFTVLLPNAAIE